MKFFVFVLAALMLSKFAFSQFPFIDDSSDVRVQGGVIKEIDAKFKLEKDNDFELRLWVFPRISDTLSKPLLFIMSSKSGNWNARLFKNIWTQKIAEISLKKEGLNQLWNHLNENDILTIPKAYTLVDKEGNIIFRSNRGLLYSFELLSKNASRSYAYECPIEYSKMYDYIPTYKKVALIIQDIASYIGISQDFICLK